MKYDKILEVSQDSERVYFSFFFDNNQRIIGIPKKDSLNTGIYIGKAFDSLNLVDVEQAKALLTELVKKTMLTHPYRSLCDINKFELILGTRNEYDI